MSERLSELIDKYGDSLKEKLLDPVFFINEIIGFKHPPFKLTPYQEEWLRLVDKHDKLNLMAFRSSGKSELFFVDYPIFKAFTQPGWQGMLVSHSQRQVTGLMRRIREKILENEILRTSVPDSRTLSWSKTEIQLKNGSLIMSRPNTPALAGEHVDYVGGDEVGYWQDMDIITKVIPPMVLSKRGKVVFIGTPSSSLDPIHKLQKNPAYFSGTYSATRKMSDGKTLWQHRYPDNPMESVRKQYDSMSWSREFLCKPLSSKDRIYPWELVSPCLDGDSSFYEGHKTGSAYYIGLDFALSAEAGADYTVYTVLEKRGDVSKLVNIERYKGMPYQTQKMRIIQLAKIYRPIKIVADKGTFGESFIQDLRSEGLNVEAFKFTNQSKQELHTNMRNMFEQKRLMMCYDETDFKTKDLMDRLLKELSQFGVIVDEKTGNVKFEGLGEHDDMVTSLALSAWGSRGLSSGSWVVGRSSRNNTNGLFFMGRVN